MRGVDLHPLAQNEPNQPAKPRQTYVRTQKLKVTRHVWDAASGKSAPVSEVVEIGVKPGWKKVRRKTGGGVEMCVCGGGGLIWGPGGGLGRGRTLRGRKAL